MKYAFKKPLIFLLIIALLIFNTGATDLISGFAYAEDKDQEEALETVEEESNQKEDGETQEVQEAKEEYDIAIIDTGGTEDVKCLSVLGDDGLDRNGHGERIIKEIKSIFPEAKILSIKALSDDGVGDEEDVYSAIKLAMEMDVKIINLSISAPYVEDSYKIEEIINEAIEQDIKVVVAAGNDGIDTDLTLLGKIEQAIIVGSSDSQGNRTLFSNYGENVDLYIPGSVTSISAAKVSGYLGSKGSLEGIEDFFFGEENRGYETTEAIFLGEKEDHGTKSTEEDNQEETEGAGEVQDETLGEIPSEEQEQENTKGEPPSDASSEEPSVAQEEIIIEEPNFDDKELDKELDVLVKYLLVDSDMVEEGDTFESVMFQKEGAPVLLQFMEMGKAYLDQSGTYSILVDTPFRNKIAKGNLLDIAFAKGNDKGQVIKEGIGFDIETYTATINKESISRNYDDFSDLQIQLLVPAKLEKGIIKVTAKDELGLADIKEGDYEASPFFNFEINLAKGDKAANLSLDNITAKVNGTDFYGLKYDKETGNLEIPMDSIGIKTVEIIIHEKNVKDRIKKAIFSASAPNISRWLTLDGRADISKLSKGKEFTEKCYYIGSAASWDYDWGVKTAPNVFSYDTVKAGSVFGYASNGETGFIALPEKAFGISNFILSGPSVYSSSVQAVGITKGGVKYNPGMMGNCYHANVAKNTTPGVKNVKFQVVDVTEKSDGYTYVTMAYLMTGGATSGTATYGVNQTTGGYFGFRQESKEEPDLTNLTIYKRAYNDEGRRYITDIDPEAYAVFKLELFEGKTKEEGTPTRTWHFRTRKKSEETDTWPAGSLSINVMAHQAEGYKNDPMYLDGSKVYFPEGLIKITEVEVFPEDKYNLLPGPLYLNTVSVNGKLKTTWSESTLNKTYVDYGGKKPIPGYEIYQDYIDLYNFEKMDDSNLVILKVDQNGNPIDAGENNPEMAATFKVEFFREPYTTVKDKGFNQPPERIWYYKTFTSDKDTDKGVINFNRLINVDNEFDSDQHFVYAPGYIGYPKGTLRITEEEAPKGYKPSKAVLYAECVVEKDSNGVSVSKLRWVEDTKKINGVKYIGYEEVFTGRGIMADKIQFTNYKYGKVKIRKTSAEEDITSGNPCYSLKGAQFGIYGSEEDAKNKRNEIQILTTGDDGKTGESMDLISGTYYIRELKTPPGYKLNASVQRIEVEPDKTKEFNMPNEPLYIQGDIRIEKVSSQSGNPLIKDSSAAFIVEYFTNHSFEGKPEKVWHYTTNQGELLLNNESYLDKTKENSDFYKKENQIVFPLGGIRVTETASPKGFKKSETVLTGIIALNENGSPELKWTTKEGDTIKYNKENKSPRFVNEELPIEIKTVAKDSATESHIGSALEDGEIIDVVSLRNLRLNNQYLIEGALIDVETDEVFARVSHSFTSKERDGEIVMPPFKFDATAAEGRTLVVTEVLYDVKEDKEVARHDSKTDENQRIYYPGLQTTAIDQGTEDHLGEVKEEVTIIDKVELSNLTPGVDYLVKGILMDAEKEKPYLDDKGMEVVGTSLVTATEENMTVDVAFNFSGENLHNKKIVVFEDLIYEDKIIAVHRDFQNENQTVVYPPEEPPLVPETPSSPPERPVPKTGDLGYQRVYVMTVLTSIMILLLILRKNAEK
ncbi:MAG: VaFE repeat-containing surface-anchored protein [Firmicutes bacterium]|nr:VaFE repeat-containing surface-anchored protein [Bacillota bacterium]